MTALSTLLCKSEYEAKIAASRDERMKWWREARYGMFIHYGLFSIRGAHEWAWAMENSAKGSIFDEAGSAKRMGAACQARRYEILCDGDATSRGFQSVGLQS